MRNYGLVDWNLNLANNIMEAIPHEVYYTGLPAAKSNLLFPRSALEWRCVMEVGTHLYVYTRSIEVPT